MDDAAGAETLAKGRVLRVVGVLGLFFSVQVIEVAEELVEAVVGGQELVLVAQVVLAELAGDVPQWLEQFGDSGVLGAKACVGAGHAHFGEPGADGVLTRDESRPTRGAALLAVVVAEREPFLGHSVDVGGPVAHLAAVVVADVPPADVVSPEDEDVRPLRVRHC